MLYTPLISFLSARYDRDASRYHQAVYKRKRADLISVLDSTLSPLFLGQLKNLHKSCLVAFKKEMHEGMRGEGYNFAEVVTAVRARCEKNFVDGGKEALVEETDWTYEDEFTLLKEEIRGVADQCRKDETKKMINAIEVCFPVTLMPRVLTRCFQRNFKRQISEPVDLCLNKPTPDMWDNVLKTFREALDKSETIYLTKAKSTWIQMYRAI